MFSYWAKPEHTLIVSRYLNDQLKSSIDIAPDRFVGLGTLPMNDPSLAIQELDRCIGELNFQGIMIGSHIGEYNLDHPRFADLFARAEELGAAIFVHPWDMPYRPQPFWAGWLAGMPAETSKTICDLIFGGVMDTYPNLRFAFAHCGGSFPGTIGRIEHGFNVRPDLFPNRSRHPRKYLGRFWVDTLTADTDVLKYNLSVLGLSSVMLGSDYPFPLGEKYPGKIVEEITELTNEEKQAILATNVFDWLGLSADQYM